MSRETENVLLLLVGVAIGMITLAGNYLRYVKPALFPWLLTAAVVLIVLALACIVRDVRRGPRDEHDGGSGHRHRAGIAWLLVLPIAVLIFVVPPALAPSAATRSVATSAQRQAFAPLPAEPAPVVSLPEVLTRLANDTAGTLNGRTITVNGFTMKDGDHVDLARVVIICCAADAQLARIHLAGPAVAAAATLADQSWVRVRGQVVPKPADGNGLAVPTFTVVDVAPIPPPANTYDY